jgi:nicotinamide riboside kinase
LFKHEVESTTIPFVEIGGSWEQRQKKAVAAVNNIMVERPS